MLSINSNAGGLFQRDKVEIEKISFLSILEKALLANSTLVASELQFFV